MDQFHFLFSFLSSLPTGPKFVRSKCQVWSLQTWSRFPEIGWWACLLDELWGDEGEVSSFKAKKGKKVERVEQKAFLMNLGRKSVIKWQSRTTKFVKHWKLNLMIICNWSWRVQWWRLFCYVADFPVPYIIHLDMVESGLEVLEANVLSTASTIESARFMNNRISHIDDNAFR